MAKARHIAREFCIAVTTAVLCTVSVDAVAQVLEGMECETRFLEMYQPVPDTTDINILRFCGQSGLLPDTLERSYILCVSSQLKNDPEAVPLVLALHGGGGRATSFQNRLKLEERGLTDEFIVAYPNACRLEAGRFVCDGGVWNAGGAYPETGGVADVCDIDDDVFMNAVINDIRQTYPLEPDRIYAVGHSKGGMFAYRLGCDGACDSQGQDCFRLAAIGVAGATLTDLTCNPTSDVSIFHVHNVQDLVVPFVGGGIQNRNWPPVLPGLEFWADVNGCTLPFAHDYFPPPPGFSRPRKSSVRTGVGRTSSESMELVLRTRVIVFNTSILKPPVPMLCARMRLPCRCAWSTGATTSTTPAWRINGLRVMTLGLPRAAGWLRPSETLLSNVS